MTDTEDLLKQARKHIQAGRYKSAQRFLGRILKFHLEHPELRMDQIASLAFLCRDQRVFSWKLKHDLDQLSYLKKNGKLSSRKLKRLEILIRKCGRRSALGKPIFRNGEESAQFADLMNRGLQGRSLPPGRLVRSPINPDLNFVEIASTYERDGLVVIDDFLTPSAIRALSRFCMEFPIWSDIKTGQYIGAQMSDGFVCPLLFQIVDELTKKMPDLLRRHRLSTMWVYECFQNNKGIPYHADRGVVNANLWITPDVANLEKRSGGILICPKQLQNPWKSKYNSSERWVDRYVKRMKFIPIRIPYQFNRIVLFESMRPHATDDFKFTSGYENRRRNITFIFG